jgi:hypothetical protein
MKRPETYKYPNPSFGVEDMWEKIQEMAKGVTDEAKPSRGDSRKRATVNSAQMGKSSKSAKRQATVHKMDIVEENDDDDDEDDNLPDPIVNTAWAARVAAAYNCSPAVSQKLFHLSDEGTWPTAGKSTKKVAFNIQKAPKCSFCLEENTHGSADCTLTMDEKHAKVRVNDICRKCLEIGHKYLACTKPSVPCTRCRGDSHHRALCVARLPESVKSLPPNARGGFGGKKGYFRHAPAGKDGKFKAKGSAKVYIIDTAANADESESEDPDKLPESVTDFLEGK